jgi:hypothetical protein
MQASVKVINFAIGIRLEWTQEIPSNSEQSFPPAAFMASSNEITFGIAQNFPLQDDDAGICKSNYGSRQGTRSEQVAVLDQRMANEWRESNANIYY